MTTSRDPDAILAAYLAEGMTGLPDRVVEAVLDEAHRTRQRTVIGPWRFLPMSRLVLGAAAVIAVLVGGAIWLGAFRPADVGAPSPSPSASPTASPTIVPTPSPTPLPEIPLSLGNLAAGPYQSTFLSQPMTLVIPDPIVEFADIRADFDGEQAFAGYVYGDRHTIQLNVAPLNVALTIHDDAAFHANLCRHTLELQLVPETPEDVAAWLHAQEENVTVTDVADMTIDGRTVKVFDLVTGPTCGSDPLIGRPDVWFSSSESHRIYAIPTGSDTILAVTWNQGGFIDQARVNTFADGLVSSFDFGELVPVE